MRKSEKLLLAQVHEEEDDVIDCALCGAVLLFSDSYSPGDEAICASCDTQVTGRQHGKQKEATKCR